MTLLDLPTRTRQRLGHAGLESAVVEFNPDSAARYLETYKYEGQRTLSQSQVDELTRSMKDGSFTLNNVVIGTLDDQSYLINGQHTLWAIIESGVSIRLPVNTIAVPSEDALAHLYSTLDIPRTRQPQDGFKGYHIAEKTGLSEKEVGALFSAVRLVENGFSTNLARTRLHQLRPRMMDWAPVMLEYMDCVGGQPMGAKMKRRDLLAVGLVTITEQPTVAKRFWTELAADDGLRQGSPCKALITWLDRNAIRGGGRIGSGVTTKMALRAVAYAWNAYYEKREIAGIRISASSLAEPIQLRGTEYE